MDLDITRFVRANRHNLNDFADSVAHSGLQNIGALTWAAAVREGEKAPIVTTESHLDDLVDHFADYGAWSREELEAHTPAELNGLLIQFVAGDVERYIEAREGGRKAFAHYSDTEGGRVHGHRGRWFYYIGS